MNRRQFLQTAVALTAVTLIARYLPKQTAAVAPLFKNDKPLINIPFFVGVPGSRKRTYIPIISRLGNEK